MSPGIGVITTPTDSHWFEYFPGNHMWSQGMMFGIEMAGWGAAAISEIDQIGQRLRGHEGDNERWWSEWTNFAQRIEGFGDRAETEGHRLTAGAYYLRARYYEEGRGRFLTVDPAEGVVGSSMGTAARACISPPNRTLLGTPKKRRPSRMNRRP